MGIFFFRFPADVAYQCALCDTPIADINSLVGMDGMSPSGVMFDFLDLLNWSPGMSTAVDIFDGTGIYMIDWGTQIEACCVHCMVCNSMLGWNVEDKFIIFKHTIR